MAMSGLVGDLAWPRLGIAARRKSLDLGLAERLPCPHAHAQFWIELHSESLVTADTKAGTWDYRCSPIG